MFRSRSWLTSTNAIIAAILIGLLAAGCSSEAEKQKPEPEAPPAAEPEKEAAPQQETPSAVEEPAAVVPAFEDNFDPGWEDNQTAWRVATWTQNKTEMSPERCRTDGKGMLVQTLLAGEPAKGGSMQSTGEFPYGRWQARLKPSSVTGLCNTMFTDDWEDMTTETPNDGTKFEVDIELLTYTFGEGKGKVHLAVHVPEKSNAFVEDVDLGFNPSDDFHLWGFDILPDKIIWHIDGKILRTWERPEGMSFNPNYELFFNSRSQRSWIRGPAPEDAHYYIDWVRFYRMDQLDKLPELKPWDNAE